MERRTLLKLGALGAGTAALSGCLDQVPGVDGDGREVESQAVTAQGKPLQETEATRTLRAQGHADPYLDVEPTGEVKEYEFWVHSDSMNPYGDEEFHALTFSQSSDEPGSVPAPEIRVQQGDTVRVKLHSPAHTIHWHGYDVPWDADGVPYVTQPVGDEVEDGTYVYEFEAKQPGTYWYHCVIWFPIDMELGLFGPLIVEPKGGPELPYDRDATLMFHEADSEYFDTFDGDPHDNPGHPFDAVEGAKHNARFATDVASSQVAEKTGVYGSMAGPRPYHPDATPRYRPNYDAFMINGKSYPETQPVKIRTGETVRLRLINAGLTPKTIHLHGHHFLVTHKDGYPLEDPYWADSVPLPSGHRKDVYVQGTNPGIWKMHNHGGFSRMGSANANDYAFPGGQITALVYEDFEPPEGLPAGHASGEATAGDYAVHAQGNR